MANYDYFPDGDILVVREGFNPEDAQLLESEWDCYRGVYGISSDQTSPTQVETLGMSCLTLSGGTTMAAQISDRILGDLVWTYDAAINRQHPRAFQYFHADGKNDPVAIVHGSNYGAFDYVILDADPHPYITPRLGDDTPLPSILYHPNPKDVRTIEVNAGDVLIQLAPWLIHRGRNLGEFNRVNLGLYGN